MKSKIFFASLLVILFFNLVGAVPYYSEAAKQIYVVEENNLADLSVLNKTQFEIVNGNCDIKVPLEVKGTLYVNNNSCETVRLYPDSYIKVTGKIYFEDVKVFSYNPETGEPMNISKENYNQKRPYITVVAPGRYFYAKNTDFGYLGYAREDEGSAWGISFYNMGGNAESPAVEIINSSIHNNYFGVYTFNTRYVNIYDSKIYDNLEYGLDFHDYSENYLIKNNEIYNNGNHALIFSKFCENNQVIGNYIHDNNKFVFVKGEDRNYGTHGIMLHHASGNNLIENNTLENNRVGIYLENGDNNIIRGNKIINDNEDGIYISLSDNNLFENNSVENPGGFGLYSYFSENNSYSDNYIENGIYVKGERNDLKFNIFYNESYFNEEEINSSIAEEIYQPNTEILAMSLLGVRDKTLLSKIFFIVGILIVVFFIMLIEFALILIKKHQMKNGKRILY